MPWPNTHYLLLLLALVLFILGALIGGGVFAASGFGWLTDGGLAALTLAFMAWRRGYAPPGP